MTIEQFKTLEPEEQRKAIKAALAMGARTESGIHVNFYKLDGFYIEEYFHPKYRTVLKYIALTEKEFINLYLNK